MKGLKRSPDYVPGTSDEAVCRATGRDWQEWFAALDEAGGIDMDHKRLVAWLRDAGGLSSGWWQQSVAVEYEKARGLRAVVGETADAGFQLGVSRTVRAPASEVWEYLSGPDGQAVWLEPVTATSLTAGNTFQTADGTTGEFRVVKPGTRLRLTWHPPQWSRPSTLQLTLSAKSDRCSLTIHLERLPNAAARESMRERWKDVLGRIQQALSGD